MMMSLTNYKLATLVSIFFFSIQFVYAQYDVEKEVNDEYDVSSGGYFNVDNRHGDLNIETWDQNKITVSVKIKAWARRESSAHELLDDVIIEKSQTSEGVTYKTVIPNKWSHNDREGVEINYFVKMPKKNALTAENKYGSVYLDDIEGSVRLEVGYGKLYAQRLESASNFVEMKYGDAEVEYINRGEIYSRYCGRFEIEEAGDLEIDDKYGNMRIDKVRNIKGESGYANLRIEELSESLDIENKYSNVEVDEVKEGFEGIYIETKYGGARLGFAESANFTFEVETHYGDFSYHTSGLKLKRDIQRQQEGEFSGYRNKESGGKVRVYASYGGVKFR